MYGYCLSTVLVFQMTFAVNSVGHRFGPRRFDTGDGSRNNWVVGYLSFGDGWHNNHHRVPASARHGFAWYEFDQSYLTIRLLAWLGLVWGVKLPPAHLLSGKGPPDDAPTGGACGGTGRDRVRLAFGCSASAWGCSGLTAPLLL